MSKHPGEVLADLIRPELKKDFAARAGISGFGLWKILNGRQRVGPRMAERLAKATGKPVRFWLEAQLEADVAGQS